MIIWNDIALIEDDSHFTVWVKEAGRLDHHRSILERSLPYLNGVVVDVGANIGTHTFFYAQHASKVIAIEPLPAAMECLRHNLRNFDNVELIHAAAGASVGTVDLYTPEKNYGASFTVVGSSTPVVTIDSLGLPACSYMKLDAEGDEIAILRGAEVTIARCRPVLCVECNPCTLSRKGLKHTELLDCIRAFGYEIRDYDESGYCDILCVPS